MARWSGEAGGGGAQPFLQLNARTMGSDRTHKLFEAILIDGLIFFKASMSSWGKPWKATGLLKVVRDPLASPFNGCFGFDV